MPFQVTCDIAGAREALTELKDSQLPFTIARTLTRCAQDAQGVVRTDIPGIFKVRNDWTVQGIRITPATKQTLFAVVRTDTANRMTGAPDYLPRQDEGGEKLPVAGRMHIAVPTKYLGMLTSLSKPIPDALRPRALLAYADQQGRYTSRRGTSRPQPPLIRGMVFFVSKFKSGKMAIFGRYFTEQNAYPLYLLTPEAHVIARFPMEDIVFASVNATFKENFRKSAIEVITNDYMRGSGFQIKI